MECLNDIIGLMSSECECITSELTDEQIKEITTSKSKLFIDNDLNGVINLRALNSKASCKNIVSYFNDSKTSAVNKYYEDLMTGISMKYNDVDNNYSGDLGKSNYIGSVNSQKPLQFFKLTALNESDATIHINSISVGANKTATTEIKIVRVDKNGGNAEVLQTIPITLKAGIFVNVDANISLPITAFGVTYNYFVVWERESGVFPLDNQADCNCGGSRNYQNFIDINGGECDTLSELNNTRVTSDAMGIKMNVTIKCEASNLICREFSNRNAISISTAWAILYLTGANILTRILNSESLDRYTTMNREAMINNKNYFESEYGVRMKYIVESINVNSSDCYICNQNRVRISYLEA